ncbi:hypothetical protein SCMU_34830 [Sinomonas cyclohexanicum]|uniref:Uncharacterized protein n=1 Tax=Sinomonas cyclohexanicum TaxID=322009 RepID=A0ABM7PZA6_SINCY|nr:hypothetical protein SCMU_34830 [Corynebacterium cyclohexanicum]
MRGITADSVKNASGPEPDRWSAHFFSEEIATRGRVLDRYGLDLRARTSEELDLIGVRAGVGDQRPGKWQAYPRVEGTLAGR